MVVKNENNFNTSDFYVCVFLVSQKYNLKNINRTDPRRVLFVFNDFEGREGLVRDFLYGKTLVEPQQFISSIKTVKQLLYSYD